MVKEIKAVPYEKGIHSTAWQRKMQGLGMRAACEDLKRGLGLLC